MNDVRQWVLWSVGLRGGAVLLAAAGVACAASPAPSARSATEQAQFMERTRCGDDDGDGTLAPVLSGAAVQEMKPLYARLEGAKSGMQSELRGVTLTVQALPNITAEWLDRALECHSARSVLGHGPALPGDPFWLPGSTVDIDVRSAKDGFEVAVTAFSAQDARQILARATAFTGAKTQAAH